MTERQSPERSGQSLPGHALPPPADTPQAAGTPPPAGTPGNPLRITDPQVMRALAHPARIAIWQFLGLEGPATATECAEIAGLSPSACSYHLRTLARYGFVEEDPVSAADGRQRPWRVKVVAFALPNGPDDTPGMRAAGRMLNQTLHAQLDELWESYLDRQAEYTAQWQEALGDQVDVLHVAPEELIELRRRLTELFGEYRRLSRAERPPGAGRVYVTLGLIPSFEPDESAPTRKS
jgi:DNA-binding transcriptional ArsR family regulator